MEEDRLLALSAHVIIQYFEAGEKVFERHTQHLAVLKEGVVSVSLVANDESQLIETFGEGETVGVYQLLPEDKTEYMATCKENALLYFIPLASIEEELLHNPRLAIYFSSGFASYKKALQLTESVSDHNQLTEQFFHLYRLADIEHPKRDNVITSKADSSIKQVALLMTQFSVSSVIIVDSQNCPIGIVTDRDLRSKVATGMFEIDDRISAIMSAPVHVVEEKSTLAEVHIAMLRHNIHHVCVTKDGTTKSAVCGIVTDTNLLLQQANNPVVIISKIQKATSIDELVELREKAELVLREYLDKEVAIAYSSDMITEINDAIIKRCISLAQHEMSVNEIDFCWLSIGSEGRREQLIRTDQDNAMIYTSDSIAHEEAIELATKVTRYLNKIGFDYCPANMMASDSNWNLSIEAWQKKFQHWIANPLPQQVMHATIFFDFRAVYGNHVLAETLHNTLAKAFGDNNLFIHYLAQNALQNPPPLSIFRNIVVEKEGVHAESFDLKARALMPFVDAARTLLFDAGVFEITNTAKRFLQLALLEPSNKGIYRSAADAYEWLLRLRAMSARHNKNSGRYVPLDQLNNWQRKNLKQSFKIIDSLQTIIKARFQLDYLRS